MMDDFESVKQDSSDILFSLREFDPPISPIYDNSSPHGLSGAQVIQQVLNSPRIKNAASEIASKQGKDIDAVFNEVKKILEEIGHTFTLKSIRFMAYLLRKVFRNIYSGIKVNKAGLNKVKELSKEFPVIIVPSHRSYTDFLLVSFVCYIFHLPLPVIAAAQDFKNMAIIGGLLRNCGAFYMKRSFRNDELYWVVFFEYVQSLILNCGTTMEFFLEGTRSRSGKSLHPKQGLLSILTDLYFTSRVPDIMFCPVSISYERVLEETLLARELLGVPKPKESLKGLLNSHSVLSDDYGFAYLYFGKPISLREFSEGKISRLKGACIPRSIRTNPSSDEMAVVQKLACHILGKIQDHLILLPSMVVAAILLQNPEGIDLELLIHKYSTLVGWCKRSSIPVIEKEYQDSRSSVMESLQLLKSSLMVSQDNYISPLDPEHFSEEFKNRIFNLIVKERKNCREHSFDSEPVVPEEYTKDCPNEEGDNKGKILAEWELSVLNVEDKDYLINLTCIHLQLAHQRNQLLHWFYVPAMVALTRKNQRNVTEDELYHDAKLIGDLVAIEVARDTFPSKEEFLYQLKCFKELEIIESNNKLYTINYTEALSFVSALWRPLLTSYWVVYAYIIEFCVTGTEYVIDALIHNCQEFAVSLFLKGVVKYLEIQSLELLRNGLKSLVKSHIVKQLKIGSEKRIEVLDKTALHSLAGILEEFLQLSYVHPHSFPTSKL